MATNRTTKQERVTGLKGTVRQKDDLVSFEVSRDESKIITAIAQRAVAMAAAHGIDYRFMDAEMDITATHANGCKLRLQDLASADGLNFAHDIFGIRRHLDRETGKLTDCFLPRFARPARVAA